MVSKTKTVVAHPEENQVGQDKSIILTNEMDIDDIRESIVQVADVESQEFQSHAEELEFMEELVEVYVIPSADENAEKIVDVYCNGVPQRFIRGKRQTVKRKFVEVLARAKPFSVKTPQVKDGNGEMTTAIETNTGLRYPFEMRDKNPRGQAWLQGILAEA